MDARTTRDGWIGHGVYGQYRTARSVSEALRRQGWRTRIVQDRYGNATVQKRRPAESR